VALPGDIVALSAAWPSVSGMSTDEVVRRYYDALGARDWETFAATLTPDVVYEMPQTRERIAGQERYVRFNREYPGDWEFDLTRLIAGADRAVGTMNFRIGDESVVGITFFELRDGLISRLTDLWPEPYQPPAGREHLTERPDDPSAFVDRFS